MSGAGAPAAVHPAGESESLRRRGARPDGAAAGFAQIRLPRHDHRREADNHGADPDRIPACPLTIAAAGHGAEPKTAARLSQRVATRPKPEAAEHALDDASTAIDAPVTRGMQALAQGIFRPELDGMTGWFSARRAGPRRGAASQAQPAGNLCG